MGTSLSGPRRGKHAYVAGLPGFYVVNPGTNIAVGAFLERQAAEQHVKKLEADYPFDHAALVIVELSDEF